MDIFTLIAIATSTTRTLSCRKDFPYSPSESVVDVQDYEDILIVKLQKSSIETKVDQLPKTSIRLKEVFLNVFLNKA